MVEALFSNAIGYDYIEEVPYKLKRVTHGENGKKLMEEEWVEVVPITIPSQVAAQGLQTPAKERQSAAAGSLVAWARGNKSR